MNAARIQSNRVSGAATGATDALSKSAIGAATERTTCGPTVTGIRGSAVVINGIVGIIIEPHSTATHTASRIDESFTRSATNNNAAAAIKTDDRTAHSARN
jgi:hypothetical protein